MLKARSLVGELVKAISLFCALGTEGKAGNSI